MFSVKDNFKIMYNLNLFCDLCKIEICSQEYLLKCDVLRSSVPELQINKEVQYDHIFENVDKIVPAIKLLSRIIEVREELLEEAF